MAEDRAALCFEVRDDVLVSHLEHDAWWQHGAPMRHQGRVSSVVAPQFAEIIGVRLLRKQQREAREAGVDRVAAHVNDARTFSVAHRQAAQ